MEYRISVKQKGNDVQMHGLPGVVHYHVEGLDLPELEDFTFTLWHATAHVMRQGGTIAFDVPVDPVAVENARKFVRAWELCQPAKCRPVDFKLNCPAPKLSGDLPSRRETLTLFSGGVDATHMILRHGRREPRGAALTIFGMDYKESNAAQFRQLLEKTQGFLDHMNYDRVVVRTDAPRLFKGTHQWVISMLGCSFLFSSQFKGCEFAADFSWEQDFLSFPWGSNHVTNRYLDGGFFKTRVRGDDVTRSEKLEALMQSPLALASVSFCKKVEKRPHNCGLCTKCIRTKAMFLAGGHEIPDIFLDNSFGPRSLKALDLTQTSEKAFLMDVYQTARSRGMMAGFPLCSAWSM